MVSFYMFSFYNECAIYYIYISQVISYNESKSIRWRDLLWRLFYTPPHARVGDVIPFYEKGLFKPFYLKNWNAYWAEVAPTVGI